MFAVIVNTLAIIAGSLIGLCIQLTGEGQRVPHGYVPPSLEV